MSTSPKTSAVTSATTGPPLDWVPFHDAESFRAWQKGPAGKGKRKKKQKQHAGPASGSAATLEEDALLAQVTALIRPELAAAATEPMARRFVRGYAMAGFAEFPDRAERAATMLNLACHWRLQINAARLIDPAAGPLPGREAFDALAPSASTGLDGDGRVVSYMVWPGDVSAIPIDQVRLLHYQNMLRLEQRKDASFTHSSAKGSAGIPSGGASSVQHQRGHQHHHVTLLDMANDSRVLNQSMLKFMSEADTHPLGPNPTQHFFPDCVAKVIVLNAPLIFRALWAIAKRFLAPATSAKFQIVGTGKNNTASALAAAAIPSGSIPMSLGGTAPDPSGQLRNTSKLTASGSSSAVERLVTIPATARTIKWRVAAEHLLPSASAVAKKRAVAAGSASTSSCKVTVTTSSSSSFCAGTGKAGKKTTTYSTILHEAVISVGGRVGGGVADVIGEVNVAELTPSATTIITLKLEHIGGPSPVTVGYGFEVDDLDPTNSDAAGAHLERGGATVRAATMATAANSKGAGGCGGTGVAPSLAPAPPPSLHVVAATSAA